MRPNKVPYVCDCGKKHEFTVTDRTWDHWHKFGTRVRMLSMAYVPNESRNKYKKGRK